MINVGQAKTAEELGSKYNIHIYFTDLKGNKFDDDTLPKGEEVRVNINCSKQYAPIPEGIRTLTGDFDVAISYNDGDKFAEIIKKIGVSADDVNIINSSRSASFNFKVPDAEEFKLMIRFIGAENYQSGGSFDLEKSKDITLKIGDKNDVSRSKPARGGGLEAQIKELFGINVRAAD